MIVAVDTGGTKTLLALFTKDGHLRRQFKFETPKNQNDYLAALTDHLRHFTKGVSVDGVAVASPGSMNNNIITWAGGNLSWTNVDIPAALEDVLPGVPVFVENDANLGGLGETRALDTIPGFSLYVTVSTGIGTGITIDGRIRKSLARSEAGHALVEFDGVVREWESFASGKAIYNTYGKYARDITSQRTWRQIADRISRGFLAVIPILQPDVIIIGGSIGTYFERYSDFLRGILTEKLPPHIPCPPIVQAKHPEEAVVYGCYYHVLNKLADT